MEPIHVAAALLSALLHAGWNAAVKQSARPADAMAAQMIVSALLGLPGLLWSGLPANGAWFWIGASTMMNMVTVTTMLRAYEHGGFGMVYPVMRAVSVLFVVPLATAMDGDRLSIGASLGIGLVVAALGLLALGAGRDRTLSRAALWWTLAAGLSAAAYVMCDARGVRAAGSPFAYGLTVAVTNAFAMGWRQRDGGPPWRLIAAQWRLAIPTAIAAMVSYMLILWVWTEAPIAPAAALRDTSAVLAIVIAVVWLKEPFTFWRMAAVLLAAAAVPLLRLA
jgi:drug/metabolite transporter (DMT)-like permease